MHLSASDLFCVQTELAHQLLLQGQQKLIDRT